MKVYIIDDDVMSIMISANILVNSGIDVRYSLHNDKKLLEKLEKYSPDVILLDLYMPNISGEDICKMIKEVESLKNIPVVAFSSSEDLVDKLKAHNSGFINYIEKNTTKDEFLQQIKEIGIIGSLFNMCKVLRSI